jgi:hypothetical protein
MFEHMSQRNRALQSGEDNAEIPRASAQGREPEISASISSTRKNRAAASVKMYRG